MNPSQEDPSLSGDNGAAMDEGPGFFTVASADI